MALAVGIIGLPNVGKSTLFNAITNAQVEAANYPFATIEPNVGVVPLVDERLTRLAALVHAQRVVPATVQFTDIAGLVAGASRGEGLGNKFLAHIRSVDAVVHVVRCFEKSDIISVNTGVDPVHDAAIVNLELLLADLEVMTNVVNRLTKKAVAQRDPAVAAQVALATRILAALQAEQPARTVVVSEAERALAKPWQLLTLKPVIYVANVLEQDIAMPSQNRHYQALAAYAAAQNAATLAIAAHAESELATLLPAERELLLAELGIAQPGLVALTRAAFTLLGLATFFTAGVTEARAWVFRQGMNAQACAGVIHTDFARGFIRAQVISYADYVAFGGEHGAQAAGRVRIEGRDYIVQDGDVIHFRFNV